MFDKSEAKQRRANDNPWYCLATLYGEQLGEEFDDELTKRNRVAWNRWMAGALNDEQRAELVKSGFSENELVPLSDSEICAFREAFNVRCGCEGGLLPDLTDDIDFDDVQFFRPTAFAGFIFPRNVSFIGAEFSRDVSFISATFLGEVDFRCATFACNHIDFDLAIFISDTDFGGASFCGDACFEATTFEGIASFNLAKFLCNASFEKATFSHYATFESVKFSGFAGFDTTIFYCGVCFDAVEFCCGGSFFWSELCGASFDAAKFFDDVKFSSAMFSRGCCFDKAVFLGSHANFDKAIFYGNVRFCSAIFSGGVTFSSAEFSDDVHFDTTTFSANADFGSVKFSSDVSFLNTVFKEKTVFVGSRFESGVPDFRGAASHEATEWDGVRWPAPPRDDSDARNQVHCYERLKLEMARLKKFDDEQFFFCKELRARRGLLPILCIARPLNYLYQALSDYGQSVVQPILWLLTLFAIGGTIFAITPVLKGSRMPVADAAWLSFANVFSFLPIRHEVVTSEIVAGLSNAAKVVGVLQSLLGAVLLFLLCLALRSRFRMR